MSIRIPILAHVDGIAAVLAVLAIKGDLCTKCGYATRYTSKNWAKCKQCGNRVPRQQLPKP